MTLKKLGSPYKRPSKSLGCPLNLVGHKLCKVLTLKLADKKIYEVKKLSCRSPNRVFKTTLMQEHLFSNI